MYHRALDEVVFLLSLELLLQAIDAFDLKASRENIRTPLILNGKTKSQPVRVLAKVLPFRSPRP